MGDIGYRGYRLSHQSKSVTLGSAVMGILAGHVGKHMQTFLFGCWPPLNWVHLDVQALTKQTQQKQAHRGAKFTPTLCCPALKTHCKP
jgi:hypothetical protein